jgi:hypothetical protein
MTAILSCMAVWMLINELRAAELQNCPESSDMLDLSGMEKSEKIGQ